MKRSLPGDYKTLLLAIFLGVLLWLYARGEVVLEQSVTARLDINSQTTADVATSIQEGIEIVTLKIKGRKSDLERVRQTDLSVVISAELTPGEDRGYVPVTLTGDMVRGLAGNIDILNFEPPEIGLVLVRKAEQLKSVEVRIEGAPTPGYELGDIQVWPDEVTVKGSKTLLQKLDKVKTQPVNVFQRWKSFSREEVLIDPRVEGGQISCKQTVGVWVTIRPATTTEVIAGIPVHITFLADFKYDVKAETGTVSVKLKGAKEKLQELKKNPTREYPEGILAYVDVSTLSPAGVPQKEPVKFVLPSGVSLVEDEPLPQVEVIIRERKPEQGGT